MTAGAGFFYVARGSLSRYQKHVRFFILILIALLVASPHSGADTKLTQTALLTPPTGEQPIDVRIGFQLFDVVQIEETTETFELSGILTVQWKDERQAFDPATESVPVKFYQGNFQFNEIATSWYPEVSLLNSVGAFEKGEPLLRIFPDGTSILVTPVNATAKSDLQLRKYPFDQQKLQIVSAFPAILNRRLHSARSTSRRFITRMSISRNGLSLLRAASRKPFIRSWPTRMSAPRCLFSNLT